MSSFFEIEEYIPFIFNLKLFLTLDHELPPPTQEQMKELNEIDARLRFLHSEGYGDDYPELKQTLIKYLELSNKIKTIREDMELNHFVQIFKRYHIEGILENIANNCLYTNSLPTITYLLLKRDDITKLISNPDDFIFCSRFNIIKYLTTTRKVKIPLPFTIPKFNLLHIGNVCHFNSCINMLSSMTAMIYELNQIISKQNNDNLPVVTLDIFQYLLNSYSYLDLHPSLLTKILIQLHISFMTPDESTETMKKILRPLYLSELSLSTVFYWDSSDEFYKKSELNHSLSTKLSELKPLYFLCNVHDFNSLYNVDSVHVELQEFDVVTNTTEPNKNIILSEQPIETKQKVATYFLRSYIIYSGGHYICVFVNGDFNEGKLIVRNDLHGRYQNEETRVGNTFIPSSQHVLACYQRK